MENIDWLSVLALLSPIVATLVLGLVQARQKREREKASATFDIANSAKTLGDAWERVVEDLRDEIERVRDQAQDREEELMGDLQAVHIKMEKYQNENQVVLNSEMEKSKTLELRLNRVELEREELRLENEALKKLVNSLTEKLAIAQEQIDTFRAELKQTKKDVQGIKKQTGELKFPKDDDEPA